MVSELQSTSFLTGGQCWSEALAKGLLKTAMLHAQKRGGILGISSDGDDRRIFGLLKFSTTGFFWV